MIHDLRNKAFPVITCERRSLISADGPLLIYLTVAKKYERSYTYIHTHQGLYIIRTYIICVCTVVNIPLALRISQQMRYGVVGNEESTIRRPLAATLPRN